MMGVRVHHTSRRGEDRANQGNVAAVTCPDRHYLTPIAPQDGSSDETLT